MSTLSDIIISYDLDTKLATRDDMKVSHTPTIWAFKSTAHLTVALLLALLFPTNTFAQSVGADDLAKRILEREIELQQLNQSIHLKVATPSFSRARRTWLWDMGNSSMTEGGLISATALNFAPLQRYDPDDDSCRKCQRNASRGNCFCPSTQPFAWLAERRSDLPADSRSGSCFSGSMFELSTELVRAHDLHKQHLNETAVTKRVLELKNEIDALRSQYDAPASEAENAEAHRAESIVLKQIEDRALYQFTSLETDGAKNATSRYVEDCASIIRNAVGAVGNSINCAGLIDNDRQLNGRGSILNIIAASMLTVRPFVSSFAVESGAEAKRTSPP